VWEGALKGTGLAKEFGAIRLGATLAANEERMGRTAVDLLHQALFAQLAEMRMSFLMLRRFFLITHAQRLLSSMVQPFYPTLEKFLKTACFFEKNEV
jgi:hypothetical protein